MDPTKTASSTLHLLESRLHRLTYLLTGDAAWTGSPTPPAKPSSYEETISRRLLHLESELERLRDRSAVARDLLGLCMFLLSPVWWDCISRGWAAVWC
ncbi:hypothetical protein BJX68DRAFT_230426 [Aspergillus pseudodeflectus]|uniref:Uncharacterized protein n=1 Tax=Aspergillus pseudodeflectus TaxID=176178 RepID=A0ABR4KVI4_9EURO